MTKRSGSDPSDTNFILLQQFGGEYLKAAQVLADDQPNLLWTKHLKPLATLLGHSLELTLKGMLSIATMSAGSPIPFTHDLEQLASNENIAPNVSLTDEESEALQLLNQNFAHPFRARYPRLGLSYFPNHESFQVLLELAERLSTQLDKLSRQQNFDDPIVKQRLGAD